uniref:Uncharacterized protein n=1 Tax=Cacopsylla melanoneura TaxID=428564 RepID=A0A8D8T0F9_9HEMI
MLRTIDLQNLKTFSRKPFLERKVRALFLKFVNRYLIIINNIISKFHISMKNSRQINKEIITKIQFGAQQVQFAAFKFSKIIVNVLTRFTSHFYVKFGYECTTD